MTASRILKQNGGTVVTVAPDEGFKAIVATLARHRIGAVVVLDGAGRLAGIISERDVVQALAAGFQDSLALTAKDIMTPQVHTCSPDDFESDLMIRMTEKNVRHLPVVSGGKVIGMVSMGDVLALRMAKIGELWKSIENEAREMVRHMRAP